MDPDTHYETFRHLELIGPNVTLVGVGLLILTGLALWFLFMGKKFSLKWLLWLTACCGFACWLLTLPPLFFAGYFDGVVVETGQRVYYEISSNWPAEVAIRLTAAAVVFLSPLLFRLVGRRKPAPEVYQ